MQHSLKFVERLVFDLLSTQFSGIARLITAHAIFDVRPVGLFEFPLCMFAHITLIVTVEIWNEFSGINYYINGFKIIVTGRFGLGLCLDQSWWEFKNYSKDLLIRVYVLGFPFYSSCVFRTHATLNIPGDNVAWSILKMNAAYMEHVSYKIPNYRNKCQRKTCILINFFCSSVAGLTLSLQCKGWIPTAIDEFVFSNAVDSLSVNHQLVEPISISLILKNYRKCFRQCLPFCDDR